MTSVYYRNLLRLTQAELDNLLEMCPRMFRPYADASRPFREMDVPERSHLEFLAALFPHSGATDAERLAASARMFSVLAALPSAGFHRTGYERMLLEIAHWNEDTRRALAQVHAAVLATAPTAADANEWMAWFLRRQFQGRNTWDQGMRIPEDLYLEALRANHPDFRDLGTVGFDAARVHRAREAYQRAENFDRARYRVFGFGHTADPFEFGRRLEAGVKVTLHNEGRLVFDLDTTPGFPDNFPEVDLIYRDGNEICIGQVTHGDLPTLRGKYLRMMANQDVESFRETHLYDSTIQLLIGMGHLSPGAGARAELFRKVRLLVPADSVEGLRLLIASHDRFHHWAGGVLTAEQKLAAIQPIGADVLVLAP